MPRSPQRSLPARERLWGMMAGLSFVMAAAGWLMFNEQRRRARIAILKTLVRTPPFMRRPLSTVMRWWRDHWIDPWGRYRRRITKDAGGAILEVGVGQWPNLIYYHAADRLVGVETKRRNIFAARRRMRRLYPTAEIVHARPERLPFADASFDTVVASLALCSVHDQAATLTEIARVLRPTGTFRFLEHVRSQHRGAALAQAALTPLWRVAADGCHPNRDTLAAIASAGFAIISLEMVSGPWGPTLPTVCGIAQRAETQPCSQPTLVDEDML